MRVRGRKNKRANQSSKSSQQVLPSVTASIAAKEAIKNSVAIKEEIREEGEVAVLSTPASPSISNESMVLTPADYLFTLDFICSADEEIQNSTGCSNESYNLASLRLPPNIYGDSIFCMMFAAEPSKIMREMVGQNMLQKVINREYREKLESTLYRWKELLLTYFVNDSNIRRPSRCYEEPERENRNKISRCLKSFFDVISYGNFMSSIMINDGGYVLWKYLEEIVNPVVNTISLAEVIARFNFKQDWLDELFLNTYNVEVNKVVHILKVNIAQFLLTFTVDALFFFELISSRQRIAILSGELCTLTNEENGTQRITRESSKNPSLKDIADALGVKSANTNSGFNEHDDRNSNGDKHETKTIPGAKQTIRSQMRSDDMEKSSAGSESLKGRSEIQKQKKKKKKIPSDIPCLRNLPESSRTQSGGNVNKNSNNRSRMKNTTTLFCIDQFRNPSNLYRNCLFRVVEIKNYTEIMDEMVGLDILNNVINTEYRRLLLETVSRWKQITVARCEKFKMEGSKKAIKGKRVLLDSILARKFHNEICLLLKRCLSADKVPKRDFFASIAPQKFDILLEYLLDIVHRTIKQKRKKQESTKSQSLEGVMKRLELNHNWINGSFFESQSITIDEVVQVVKMNIVQFLLSFTLDACVYFNIISTNERLDILMTELSSMISPKKEPKTEPPDEAPEKTEDDASGKEKKKDDEGKNSKKAKRKRPYNISLFRCNHTAMNDNKKFVENSFVYFEEIHVGKTLLLCGKKYKFILNEETKHSLRAVVKFWKLWQEQNIKRIQLVRGYGADAARKTALKIFKELFETILIKAGFLASLFEDNGVSIKKYLYNILEKIKRPDHLPKDPAICRQDILCDDAFFHKLDVNKSSVIIVLQSNLTKFLVNYTIDFASLCNIPLDYQNDSLPCCQYPSLAGVLHKYLYYSYDLPSITKSHVDKGDTVNEKSSTTTPIEPKPPGDPSIEIKKEIVETTKEGIVENSVNAPILRPISSSRPLANLTAAACPVFIWESFVSIMPTVDDAWISDSKDSVPTIPSMHFIPIIHSKTMSVDDIGADILGKECYRILSEYKQHLNAQSLIESIIQANKTIIPKKMKELMKVKGLNERIPFDVLKFAMKDVLLSFNWSIVTENSDRLCDVILEKIRDWSRSKMKELFAEPYQFVESVPVPFIEVICGLMSNYPFIAELKRGLFTNIMFFQLHFLVEWLRTWTTLVEDSKGSYLIVSNKRDSDYWADSDPGLLGNKPVNKKRKAQTSNSAHTRPPKLARLDDDNRRNPSGKEEMIIKKENIDDDDDVVVLKVVIKRSAPNVPANLQKEVKKEKE